jgi:hypothetical protein
MEKLILIGVIFLSLIFIISFHQLAYAKTWRSALTNGIVVTASGLAPFLIAIYFRH